MGKIIAFDEEKKIWTVKTDDLRSCFFAYDYLLNRNVIQYKKLNPLGDLSFISATGFCITLTGFLATKYKRIKSDKTEELKNIMLHLQETYDVSFLPLEYFSWVKNNKFACMWLWIKIRTETPTENHRRIGRFIRTARYKPRPRYSYSDVLELEQHPVNHDERFNLIINFFDKHSEKYRTEIRNRVRQKYSHKLVLIEELRYLNDKKYVEDLKYQWLNIYNKDDPLNWVKKTDENQCRWIWSFLQDKHDITPAVDRKKGKKEYVQKDIVVFNDFFPFELFLFANNEERYLGIYGVVHSTPDSENKEKLLGLMKKLWLQNTRRKNSKKKKVTKPKKAISKANTEHIELPNNDAAQSIEPLEIKSSASNKIDKQYAEFGHADFKDMPKWPYS